MLGAGVRSAYARSNELGKVYMVLSMFILVLWWGYPVVWGLAEGSNTISIKAEARAPLTQQLPWQRMWGVCASITVIVAEA